MSRRNQTAGVASPLITWSPPTGWSDPQTNSNTSSSVFRTTGTRGAFASFSFTGTGVWIYGPKRPNHGPYVGSIDGVDTTLSGYSDALEVQDVLYSATNLTMGPHVVKITDAWTNATAQLLSIDFIVWETEVANTTTRVVDDIDPSLSYSPSSDWSVDQCANISGYVSNTCHSTSASGSVSLNFFGISSFKAIRIQITNDTTGDAIAVYGGVGPGYGPYSVKLDSASSQYTANSSMSLAQQILYFASGLGPEEHTLVLENAGSAGQVLDVDYFQIVGGGPATATVGGTPPAKKNHTGAIVGAIVAIVAVLLLGALAFILYRRRHRRANYPLDIDGSDEMALAVPTPHKVSAPSTHPPTLASSSAPYLAPTQASSGPYSILAQASSTTPLSPTNGTEQSQDSLSPAPAQPLTVAAFLDQKRDRPAPGPPPPYSNS